MTITMQTVCNALINVAKTTIKAQISDPTWGDLYTRLQFKPSMLVDTLDWPTIAIYEVSGQTQAQGLGTVKRWRYPTIRVDVAAGRLQDIRQIIEAACAAWITDFNNGSGNGTVGNGYLRQAGGLKNISFSDMRSAPLDKREFFRRFIDIAVEFGD